MARAVPDAADLPSARRDRALLIVAAAVAAFCLAQLLHFGYGRDQGIYAAVGRAMLDGGAPYRDAWDFKPPGIFFVYFIAGLIDSGAWAIRVIEAVALASLVLPCLYIGREATGTARAGMLSAAVAIVTHVSLEFWHTGQPEGFGGVLVIWGLALSLAAERAPWRRLSWIMSGVLFGAAAVLKPTMAPAALAPLLTLSPGHARQGRWRSAAEVALLLMLGGLVAPAATAAYFIGVGAWRDAVDALLGFAPKYVALSWAGTGVVAVTIAAATKWLTGFGYLYGLGLLVGCAQSLRHPNPATRRVLAATALLLPGVVAQAKFFGYHFGSVLLLSSVIAGWGYWQVWAALRHRRSGVLAYAVVLLWLVWTVPSPDLEPFRVRSALRLVALMQPEERQQISRRLYSVADFDAGENARVAERILNATPPTARIHVWGLTPNLYLLTGRRPASRYVYNLAQRSSWSRESSRRELMTSLLSSPPDLIVVEHGDRVRHITGADLDSAEELAGFTSLQQLLSDRYQPTHRGSEFDIHERLPRPLERRR
jgi:hypothetical protein